MAASLGPTLVSSPSSSLSKRYSSFSICFISNPQHPSFHFSKCFHQLGICKFSTWNGLRHLGVPTSQYVVKIERKKRCKGVSASLFGVGAPEALVIGVVALLVFGPKGLAEVARNIGKTLRAFQPTIRELQEVSRDFKSTLEREIGLDETEETAKPITRTPPTAAREDSLKSDTPNSSPSTSEASLNVENAKTKEEQVEASGAQQQKETEYTGSHLEPKSQSEDGSLSSKEAETQEYLKKLEERVEALLAEKQKKSGPAVTEAKPAGDSFSSREAPLNENDITKSEQEQKETQPTESQEAASEQTSASEVRRSDMIS